MMLLTLIRLSGTYQTAHRAVTFSSLSSFLNQERYKVRKCLDKLVECKMLKKTKDRRFPKALCLVINRNYSEWTCARLLYEDALGCLNTSKLQTTSSPAASTESLAAAEETPDKVEHRSRGKKHNIKSSGIHKYDHSTQKADSCSVKKHNIKSSEIHKFDHSLLTKDVRPAFNTKHFHDLPFKIQNSSFKIQHFHAYGPRAPALEELRLP